MSAKKLQPKTVVNGKAYDYDKLEDLVELQAILVPDNWPMDKKDCVRVFLSLQEMLALQFRRHLAYNFKKIAKTAIDQKADGEDAKVRVTFGFEIDMTALNLAAFGKHKMGFNHKFVTEGKAQSFDVNQGDFLSPDGLSVALNTESLAEESAPEPKPEPEVDAPEGKKKGAKKKPAKKKVANDAPAGE